LVADGHRDTADSLGRVLGLRGFDARVVYSGKELLHVAGYLHPHVIITEVLFPDMDGSHIAQRLRAQTVLIAATVHETSRMQCHASGFHLFLVKPYDAETLCQLLERLERQLVRRPESAAAVRG
jgi:DNA-binding response OmpR family regulator